MALGIQGSCYPHRDNYLNLDPVYSDAYGQPLVRMTFDWRDNELRRSEYVTKKMEEIAKHVVCTARLFPRTRRTPRPASRRLRNAPLATP
jgi:hypothetical protein